MLSSSNPSAYNGRRYQLQLILRGKSSHSDALHLSHLRPLFPAPLLTFTLFFTSPPLLPLSSLISIYPNADAELPAPPQYSYLIQERVDFLLRFPSAFPFHLQPHPPLPPSSFALSTSDGPVRHRAYAHALRILDHPSWTNHHHRRSFLSSSPPSPPSWLARGRPSPPSTHTDFRSLNLFTV